MIRAEEVIKIHKLLIDQFGGSHGLRDEPLLVSAISRPFATFGQEDLYPDSIDKAAAILESIVTNHPFIDGNKRTGYVLARLMILEAGQDIYASQEEKYEMVMLVSQGKWKYDHIRAWLAARCK
jgi:death-on-curing protein